MSAAKSRNAYMAEYIRKRSRTVSINQPIIVGRFFEKFYSYVKPWFLELVRTYKERADFPVFPTAIADFYTDRRDKEIALMSTLCMNWEMDGYTQIDSMRRLIGEHPWEWFESREFVYISTGSQQDKKLWGCGVKYWQIARLFDRLYDLYKKNGSLEGCFPATKDSKFEGFAEKTLTEIERPKQWQYKASVIEIVLRTSDGIGLGLWKNYKAGVKCPRRKEIKDFLKMWIADFCKEWDFDETIRWFGFDADVDFFYFWLAWTALARRKPRECSKLTTVFYSRYNDRYIIPWRFWRHYLPEIDFG